MRSEFINMFAEINASQLESLTKEVKETVAPVAHAENAKPMFTAANLWNIHNMKRPRASRREFLS
jgi:hypothetical protein